MKRVSAIYCVSALAAMCVCAAGAQQAAPTDGSSGTQVQRGVHVRTGSVEFLSDTQGVNFQPYMKLLLSKIDGQWMPLLPVAARLNPGEIVIRFTIHPDGTFAAMHLDESTHDVAMDRAALGAIAGVGKFPALPQEFHGPDLELRIHFVVNQ
jgi:TonB family protein